MKCPACWTEKAYVREVEGWKGVLLAWLLLRPMQCHHCYHEFTVFWLSTLGKQIRRIKEKTSSPATAAGPACAAQDGGAARTVPFQPGAVVSGPTHRATQEARSAQNAQNAKFKRAA